MGCDNPPRDVPSGPLDDVRPAPNLETCEYVISRSSRHERDRICKREIAYSRQPAHTRFEFFKEGELLLTLPVSLQAERNRGRHHAFSPHSQWNRLTGSKYNTHGKLASPRGRACKEQIRHI